MANYEYVKQYALSIYTTPTEDGVLILDKLSDVTDEDVFLQSKKVCVSEEGEKLLDYGFFPLFVHKDFYGFVFSIWVKTETPPECVRQEIFIE